MLQLSSLVSLATDLVAFRSKQRTSLCQELSVSLNTTLLSPTRSMEVSVCCFSNNPYAIVTSNFWPALSCAIDITTATIPQFLLWGVEMKRSTKRGLNVIFGLGLITSGLSIARVATINNRVEEADMSCKHFIVPAI